MYGPVAGGTRVQVDGVYFTGADIAYNVSLDSVQILARPASST